MRNPTRLRQWWEDFTAETRDQLRACNETADGAIPSQLALRLPAGWVEPDVYAWWNNAEHPPPGKWVLTEAARTFIPEHPEDEHP
jgi:hypothetical protein